MDCSGPIIMWVWPQNVAEKTFTDGSETAENVTVFSLESIPLYNIFGNNFQGGGAKLKSALSPRAAGD